MEIKLRRFSISDLDEVMEIEKASFPNRQIYSENYFKKLYQKYPEGFIVAEEKGKIFGYAISQVKNQVPTERVGEIISLAIKPDFRQKGIGEKLSNFLINQFKEREVKKVFLHVRTKNRVAISFYKKLGFEILKKIKNYYQNGNDAYLMEKKLGTWRSG